MALSASDKTKTSFDHYMSIQYKNSSAEGGFPNGKSGLNNVAPDKPIIFWIHYPVKIIYRV